MSIAESLSEPGIVPPIISANTISCISPGARLNGPEALPLLLSPEGNRIPSIQPIPVNGSPLSIKLVSCPVKGLINGVPLIPYLPLIKL